MIVLNRNDVAILESVADGILQVIEDAEASDERAAWDRLFNLIMSLPPSDSVPSTTVEIRAEKARKNQIAAVFDTDDADVLGAVCLAMSGALNGRTVCWNRRGEVRRTCFAEMER